MTRSYYKKNKYYINRSIARRNERLCAKEEKPNGKVSDYAYATQFNKYHMKFTDEAREQLGAIEKLPEDTREKLRAFISTFVKKILKEEKLIDFSYKFKQYLPEVIANAKEMLKGFEKELATELEHSEYETYEDHLDYCSRPEPAPVWYASGVTDSYNYHEKWTNGRPNDRGKFKADRKNK